MIHKRVYKSLMQSIFEMFFPSAINIVSAVLLFSADLLAINSFVVFSIAIATGTAHLVAF